MNENKYYLHRISHESNVSYALLNMYQEKGYLSMGWSGLANSEILDAARETSFERFESIFSEKYEKTRSRWNIWYFAQINQGDIIVVPLYNGLFSIYMAESKAEPISELENMIGNIEGKWDSKPIIWKDGLLYNEFENRIVDLGFYISVKAIVREVPRSYVEGPLISRMKIRGTDADICDLKEYIDRVIEVGENIKPITLYESSIDILVEQMTKSIQTVLDDSKFEKLIEWYLKKCGANSFIPAKNETGKENGADADIVAIFDNLKYVVYVQAKHHIGETSDWAVQQIKEYKEQKSGDSEYTYASWVISSADSFSPIAIDLASENSVRLINGKEFSRMLLDIGLLKIDEAY